jgi:acetoin:2,6-dichlorophenolindophenol oxidoreductase subunit alpha
MKFTEDLGLKMLRGLILIRETEKRIATEYSKYEMKCPVHLSLGQEASAVGVCLNLHHKDRVYAGHRSHGAYLAKGGDLKKMTAELYGKKTGCSGGRGGSMHLIDKMAGFMGTSAIVGGIIPIAVGDAFAAKLKGDDRVVVVFFGDGAVEEGVFYESMKFASLHKLHIVFVCENNSLAVDTPLHVRQPNDDIYKRGEALGVKGYKANGSNVLLTSTNFREAMAYVLQGEGPALVELTVERWADHVGHKWQATSNCPINRLEDHLLEKKIVSKGQIEKVFKEVKKEVDDAFSFAKKSPFPKVLKSKKSFHLSENKPLGLQSKITYAEALSQG